ncbi:MAG: hypothetical protein R2827_09130 [Bdellovibrionales bacterium]
MTILFMCAANSVRSQLAEGLARKYLQDHKVLSAGAGSSHVNPVVIDVLKDLEDIDATTHSSKSVDEIDTDKVDLTIAVCGESVIPQRLLQKRHLVWPFSVPTGRSGMEALALQLKKKILQLKKELEK